MWVAFRLGGDVASDHKSIVNGRVLGTNPCELPSGNRVDAILFGAGECGQGLYIDVSVTFTECYSFLRAPFNRGGKRR